MPEGDAGLDSRGSTRRHGAGRCGDDDEQEHRETERHRIARFNPEQRARKEAGGRQRGGCSEQDAEADKPQRFS